MKRVFILFSILFAFTTFVDSTSVKKAEAILTPSVVQKANSTAPTTIQSTALKASPKVVVPKSKTKSEPIKKNVKIILSRHTPTKSPSKGKSGIPSPPSANGKIPLNGHGSKNSPPNRGNGAIPSNPSRNVKIHLNGHDVKKSPPNTGKSEIHNHRIGNVKILGGHALKHSHPNLVLSGSSNHPSGNTMSSSEAMEFPHREHDRDYHDEDSDEEESSIEEPPTPTKRFVAHRRIIIGSRPRRYTRIPLMFINRSNLDHIPANFLSLIYRPYALSHLMRSRSNILIGNKCSYPGNCHRFIAMLPKSNDGSHESGLVRILKLDYVSAIGLVHLGAA